MAAIAVTDNGNANIIPRIKQVAPYTTPYSVNGRRPSSTGCCYVWYHHNYYYYYCVIESVPSYYVIILLVPRSPHHQLPRQRSSVRLDRCTHTMSST